MKSELHAVEEAVVDANVVQVAAGLQQAAELQAAVNSERVLLSLERATRDLKRDFHVGDVAA